MTELDSAAYSSVPALKLVTEDCHHGSNMKTEIWALPQNTFPHPLQFFLSNNTLSKHYITVQFEETSLNTLKQIIPYKRVKNSE